MAMFDDLFQKSEDKKYEFMKSLFTIDNNIDTKTELSERNLKTCVVLEELNEFIKGEYKFDMEYDKLSKSYKQKMISHKRKGRIEGADILKADIMALKQRGDMLSKFLGVGNR